MDYNEETVKKDWNVDYHKTSDIISVHLDLILPNAPCRIVSIDVLDFVGSEMHDIELNHIRIDRNGQYEGHTAAHGIDKMKTFSHTELSKEVDDWPGCQINGNFPIRKAPGNFHISFHSYFQYYDFLVNQAKKTVNLEHKILSLRLELLDEDDHHMENHSYKLYQDKYDKNFYNHGNAALFSNAEEKKGKFMAEHYLNIYPVLLHNKIENQKFEFHEYTFVKKYKALDEKGQDHSQMMPLLEFKLKFMPFIQYITVEAKPIGRTIVNILAICGGVFAIFGLIEGLLVPFLNWSVEKIM